LSESILQHSVKAALRKARIAKPVGYHTFRHSFATHLQRLRYPDGATVVANLGNVYANYRR